MLWMCSETERPLVIVMLRILIVVKQLILGNISGWVVEHFLPAITWKRFKIDKLVLITNRKRCMGVGTKIGDFE